MSLPTGSPSAIVAGRLVSMGLTLLTAPLIARALGPDGRGLAAAALSAMVIGPVVLGAGLPFAVQRRAAIEDPGTILAASRRPILLLLPVALAAGLTFDRLVLPGLHGSASVAMVVGLAVTPLHISALCDQAVLISRNRYLGVAVLQAIQPASYAVVISIGWARGGLDVTWTIASYTVSTILTAAASPLLTRAKSVGPPVSAKALMREGWSYSGSQLAQTASHRLDQVVMVAVIGESAAGIYAVAVAIATVPLVLGYAVGTVVFRDAARQAGAERVSTQARGIRSSIMLGTLSALALAALSPTAIPIIFGKAFSDSVAPTLILVTAAPALVTGYVATLLLGAGGRGRAMTTAQVIGLGAGLSSLMILGPAYGANGAAAASVLGYWTTLVVALTRLGLPWVSILPRLTDAEDSLRLVLKGR